MNAAVEIARQPEPSATVARFLKRPPRLLIGGEWVESRSAATIPVVDPATGRQIAVVADANAADVDRAVAAARAAFEKGAWHDMLPVQREALIWKLSDLVDKRYVRSVPVDPFTKLADTWTLIPSDDPDHAGIRDIHNGADHVASDGTAVVTW